MSTHSVRRRLGEVLSERRRISPAQLDAVIAEQRKTALLLGELLLERQLVTKLDLVSALEEVTRFTYVDCRFTKPDEAVLKLIPRAVAERYAVVPIERDGTKVTVVMAEPQNLRTLDELRFLSGLEIVPKLGFRAEILSAISSFYDGGKKTKTPTDAAAASQIWLDGIDTSDVQFFTTAPAEGDAAKQIEAEVHTKGPTPAVRLVSLVLSAAATRKSSDIHIEPQALGTLIRIRVDGVMRELTRIPSEIQNSLVSRLKILAGLDIAERRAPQDGRFLVQIGTKHLDVRVSTLPTHYGEKVVMRLLDPTATRVGFMDLGLSKEISDLLSEVLDQPQGMLLVTGPTGSGKSTTLYTCLNTLRSADINIMTVEDPVEYQLQGINQTQVNPKAGLTFATCLRSLLRQDPNVIMVGEIRDSETSMIALQAAQTGHFVLSTMHTNDSIAAVTRLLDLNVPGFMIASSVTAVMAQRLVRRLCPCCTEVPILPEFQARLAMSHPSNVPTKMFVPVGCDDCENTGYKGRVGIYEMLMFDESLRSAVRGGMRDDDIRNLARSQGVKFMQDDGLEKARLGVTSLREVMRVVPFGRVAISKCRNCSKTLSPGYVVCPYCATAVNPTVAGDVASVQAARRGGMEA